MHGNAPPNPDGDDDKDNNKDDKDDGNKDEGDVMMTFNKVACHSQGDSYLAERAGAAAAAAVVDQPVTTPPTNRMLMSSLAVAMTAMDNTIDDAIDETRTLTSGDESIVPTIALFNEGPESNRGGGTMSEVTILEGREDAIPRGGMDNNNAIIVSNNSKCK